MLRANLLRMTILAVFVLSLSCTFTGCSHDDDDDKTTVTQKESVLNTEAVSLEAAAFNVLSAVCELGAFDENCQLVTDDNGTKEYVGVETLPQDWQSASYTLKKDLFESVSTESPLLRYKTASCTKEAEEWFLEVCSSDLCELSATADGYECTIEGLGKLTFTKTDGTGGLYAAVDFDIAVLSKQLKRIEFIDCEVLEGKVSTDNSYKGIPYYHAGDLIRRNSDKTLWLCVRPSGGSLNKDYSYWISLDPYKNAKSTILETSSSRFSVKRDGKTKNEEWAYAKNLMTLKTAKAAAFTLGIITSQQNKTYEDLEAKKYDLKKLLAHTDGENLPDEDTFVYCIAYGKPQSDKKRLTSGSKQNADVKTVQPYLYSSVDKDSNTQEILLKRPKEADQGAETFYSATDYFDNTFITALLEAESKETKIAQRHYTCRNFYHSAENYKKDLNKLCFIHPELSSESSETNDTFSVAPGKEIDERCHVIFSPELCIKDNAGTVTAAKEPSATKGFTKLYVQSRDNAQNAFDYWKEQDNYKRSIDGLDVSWKTENKE